MSKTAPLPSQLFKEDTPMFGWFDPVKKMERRYAKELEAAELELARSGDRAKHAELLSAAEETGRKLDELRAKSTSA